VNRAIQTLPGVQPVDEGTGLFVRGGDFTETRVLLNDAALLNPPQLLTPTGTFVGTVDPFQLDGIFFSSGGFGARYGNALSAVAALRSLGRAERAGGSVGAGLVGPSAAGALPLGRRASVRVSGNYFDVAPIYRLNGAPRRFDPAPHGHAAGASLAYAYRPPRRSSSTRWTRARGSAWASTTRRSAAPTRPTWRAASPWRRGVTCSAAWRRR
jgi:hypothetical protein